MSTPTASATPASTGNASATPASSSSTAGAVSSSNIPTAVRPSPSPQASAPAPTAPEGAGEAPKVDAPVSPRLLKLKINGSEMEMPEERVLAAAQKGIAAEQRFRELSQRAQELEAREAQLKDPNHLWKILQDAGLDPDLVAEQRLAARIQEQMMDPRERRERELFEENQRLRQQQMDAEKQREEAAFQAEVATQAEQLNRFMEQALTAPGTNLPKNEHTVARLADKLAILRQHNIFADPAVIAAEVADEMRAENATLWAGMTYEQLIKHVPDTIIKTLRQGDIAKLRAQRQQNGQPVPQRPSPKSTEERKYYRNVDEWREALDKKFGA